MFSGFPFFALQFCFIRWSDVGLFKRADITPLLKKGDDPLNYRPSSLTPALAKVFECLIK